MKKCPTCDKTFEDSMRFCQVDGTPLLDDAPAFDPYATIVARSPIAPAVVEPEPESPVLETPADPEIHYTVGSIPISEPDDVLDLPSNDPLKTMYVSESEMQAALGNESDGADIIDIPPIETVSQPEPPSFIASEPAMPAPPPSPFEATPPPSPFATSPAEPVYAEPEPVVQEFAPVESTPVYEEPEPHKFDEAATMIQPNFTSPFDPAPAAPVEQWSPPPAPEAAWQNQEIGENTPFQPPPAGVEGQNKTLAIVSLVAGILGLTLCCGTLIPSVIAVVTGFMARGKATNDPANFGGSGLAMGGLITGGIGLVLNLAYLIFLVFFGGLSVLMGQ